MSQAISLARAELVGGGRTATTECRAPVGFHTWPSHLAFSYFFLDCCSQAPLWGQPLLKVWLNPPAGQKYIIPPNSFASQRNSTEVKTLVLKLVDWCSILSTLCPVSSGPWAQNNNFLLFWVHRVWPRNQKYKQKIFTFSQKDHLLAEWFQMIQKT